MKSRSQQLQALGREMSPEEIHGAIHELSRLDKFGAIYALLAQEERQVDNVLCSLETVLDHAILARAAGAKRAFKLTLPGALNRHVDPRPESQPHPEDPIHDEEGGMG